MKKLLKDYIKWYEEGMRIKEELITKFTKLKADESCEMINCMDINFMTDGVLFDYGEDAQGYYVNYIGYDNCYEWIDKMNEPYESEDEKYLLFIHEEKWYVFAKEFEVEDIEDCA